MSARTPILDSTFDPADYVPGGTQNANTVYAGPASGAAAIPRFRLLVVADIPGDSFGKGVLALTDAEAIRDYIEAQAAATNLTTISNSDLSALGVILLGLAAPGESSYLKFNHFDDASYVTPEELLAELVDLLSTTVQSLLALDAPTTASYLKVTALGACTYKTPEQLWTEAWGVTNPDVESCLTITPDGTHSYLPVGRLVGYTVATLPASPALGDTAFVTDADGPSYLSPVAGGSTTKCPVFFNGSQWVAH